jgi:sec-independent protein translocase protein TatB
MTTSSIIDAAEARVFGLTFDKLAVIGVVAVFIIGPQHLPSAAQRLAAIVRQLRGIGEGARERARAEFGDTFDDIEWKKLDPRQYDPRRIIRDALSDETDS